MLEQVRGDTYLTLPTTGFNGKMKWVLIAIRTDRGQVILQDKLVIS